MNLYTFSFSPTGGTAKVLSAVTAEYDVREAFDLTAEPSWSALHFGPADLCVFAAPAFSGRVPALASDRLRRIFGHGARAVVVASYGNRAIDNALLELSDLLTENGFTVIGGISAVTEHSIDRRFGAGRPDASDQKELSGFFARILERPETVPALPGTRPFQPLHKSSLVPQTTKTCKGCGLCVSSCPADAITMSANGLPVTDAARCFSCMRCVSICPNQGRNLKWMTRFAIGRKLKKVCAEPKKNQLY